MKIVLTFKTPDVMDVIERAFEKDEEGNVTEEECKITRFVEKFVKYGEYIRVEFDSDTQEVKVLETC